MSLPAWVTQYIGLPFQELGRGPDAFDCWGLVRWILLREADIEAPDYSEAYQDVGDRVAVPRAIKRGLERDFVSVERPELFDLIIIRTGGRSIPVAAMHVGLVLDRSSFIHVPEGAQLSTLDRYTERMWERRIEGFWRHVSRT